MGFFAHSPLCHSRDTAWREAGDRRRGLLSEGHLLRSERRKRRESHQDPSHGETGQPHRQEHGPSALQTVSRLQASGLVPISWGENLEQGTLVGIGGEQKREGVC